MTHISADDLRNILRHRCEAAGSETKWAKANGFGQGYVSSVLRGELNASDRLASAVGYRKQIVFLACKDT